MTIYNLKNPIQASISKLSNVCFSSILIPALQFDMHTVTCFSVSSSQKIKAQGTKFCISVVISSLFYGGECKLYF